MKRLLAFLWFIIMFIASSAQNYTDEAFTIKALPPEGILLEKGWTFHAGDNREWAKPEFDDKNWQSINPSDDIHNLVSLRQAEIGWFRLHIKVDTFLLHKTLALNVKQIGASAFYLNGNAILTLGNVSKNPKQEVLFNPNYTPYYFQFTGGTEQILSVRYSFTKSNPYFNNQGMGNPCLLVRIMEINGAVANVVHQKTNSALQNYGKAGFLYFLALLHFIFYLSYPIKRTNLYYSLFTFSIGTYYWTWYLSHVMPRAGNSFFYIDLFSFLIGIPNLFFALTAVYSHANIKSGKIYWGLFIILVLIYPLSRWPYNSGWQLVYVYAALVAMEAIRVCIKAKKQGITGTWLVLSGWLIFFIGLGFSLGIYPWFNTKFQLNNAYSYLNDFAYNIGYVSLSIPFSILLAREFAQVNRSLKIQLVEVERLSEKTIAQKQEKQQILAAQNVRLEEQVEERTTALRQSLIELKSTQAQLIQKEKMASLGELTAGIAHEIQNPLNFVNNFSETNVELMHELVQELDKENTQEAKAIASDVIDNEQKIVHHGKRADSIVKGMMQHSRVNSGQKELTDLNALVDEYLQLSYHGFMAKDKSFNAILQTHFDESISKLNVVPQDIGRVLLNLFNNAFYAVGEKKKQAVEDYEPTVAVTTKSLSNKVEIRVKDNGNGIPQHTIDKIFQPFFTTKSTGEGTGLGLSLSYDIIKAHGGELKVESKEGEGATFTFSFPLA